MKIGRHHGTQHSGRGFTTGALALALALAFAPAPVLADSSVSVAVAPIAQRLANPVDGDSGANDCMAASVAMALIAMQGESFFGGASLSYEPVRHAFRELSPGNGRLSPNLVDSVVSRLSGGGLHADPGYQPEAGWQGWLHDQLARGYPVVAIIVNWLLLSPPGYPTAEAGMTVPEPHAILVDGLSDSQVSYADPWDGHAYSLPVDLFLTAWRQQDGLPSITFTGGNGPGPTQAPETPVGAPTPAPPPATGDNHRFPDLEAQLPTYYLGPSGTDEALLHESRPLSDPDACGTSCDQFAVTAQQLGVTVDAIEFALACTADSASEPSQTGPPSCDSRQTVIIAMRVPGVSGSDTETALEGLLERAAGCGSWTYTTRVLAGKNVTDATAPSSCSTSYLYYATDTTVFVMGFIGDDATNVALLDQLPGDGSPPSSGTTVVVAADAGWVESGVAVTVGQTLDIEASGQWAPGPPESGDVGPDGSSIAWGDSFLNLTDFGSCWGCAGTLGPSWAALVGYIGDNPPPPGSYTDASEYAEATHVFLVGSGTRATADRSSELWFAMNDDAYSGDTSDNSGDMTVSVAISGG